MSTPRFITRIGPIATVLMLTLSIAQAAFAAPSNDNFADAAQISGLPYSVDQDTTGATFEADEPIPRMRLWISPEDSLVCLHPTHQ